jgi:hypothetical protein
MIFSVHPTELTLAKLMKPFPVELRAQLRQFGLTG